MTMWVFLQTVTVFLQFFLPEMNLLFCGHIGKLELDAAGLALSVCLSCVIILITSLTLLICYSLLMLPAFQ